MQSDHMSLGPPTIIEDTVLKSHAYLLKYACFILNFFRKFMSYILHARLSFQIYVQL